MTKFTHIVGDPRSDLKISEFVNSSSIFSGSKFMLKIIYKDAHPEKEIFIKQSPIILDEKYCVFDQILDECLENYIALSNVK